MKKQWTNLNSNSVLKGDGFYISYNENTSSDDLGQVFNFLGGILGIQDGKGHTETALVITSTPKIIFKILLGDYREEYEEVFNQGLQACIKVFEKYKHISGADWSTLEEDRAEKNE